MALLDPYADPPAHISPHASLVTILKEAENQEHAQRRPLRTFTDLPPELASQVMSFLPSKHDLGQVCKVNEFCFSTALPQLYSTLNIELKHTINPKLMQMFTNENAGIQYIKHVVVRTQHLHGHGIRPAFQWLDVIINQIHQNKLVSFHWATPQALPARILRLLWRRQTMMTSLEILPIVIEQSSEPTEDVDLLAQLTSITLPKLDSVRCVPDTVETAAIACAALQQGVVTKLEVDARLWMNDVVQEVDDDVTEDGDLDDEESRMHDSLTEALFQHLTRAKPKHTPTHNLLRFLTLKDVDLRFSKYTWCTYFDFSRLNKLRLEHCKNADMFLAQIASTAATPSLSALTILHDLGEHGDRTIEALEDLLHCPRNTLQELELCLRNAPKLPRASSIRSHGASLRQLHLDITGKSNQSSSTNDTWGSIEGQSTRSNHLVYSTADFLLLVSSFSNLKELAMAFPETSLEYNRVQELHEFVHWIDCVAKKNKLTTLNVLNWPKNYKSGRETGYYIAKDLQLARLASDVFTRFRSFDPVTQALVAPHSSSELRVVAFGTRESGGGSPKPAYFVQSEVVALGKKKMRAQGVKLKELQDCGHATGVLAVEEREFDENARKNGGLGREVSHQGDGWPQDGFGGWQ